MNFTTKFVDYLKSGLSYKKVGNDVKYNTGLCNMEIQLLF